MLTSSHMLARSAAALALVVMAFCSTTAAATRDELTNNAQLALDRLFRLHPAASALGRSARAVLVFPKVIKAKLVQHDRVLDGAFGEGALIRNGSAADFHYLVGRSWALSDEGSYSVALFLMTPKAQESVARGGWAIGKGAHMPVADQDGPDKVSATRLRDAYAFVFSEQGHVAFVSLEGSTIWPFLARLRGANKCSGEDPCANSH